MSLDRMIVTDALCDAPHRATRPVDASHFRPRSGDETFRAASEPTSRRDTRRSTTLDHDPTVAPGATIGILTDAIRTL